MAAEMSFSCASSSSSSSSSPSFASSSSPSFPFSASPAASTKIFPEDPNDAKAFFANVPPEHLGVDETRIGLLPDGSSPTEQFFLTNFDWALKGLVPPPSPTFYRPLPTRFDVYVIAIGKSGLPKQMPASWVPSVAKPTQPLAWKKRPSKAAILFLMPGSYTREALNLSYCPYERAEIIGAAGNRNHVLVTGPPGNNSWNDPAEKTISVRPNELNLWERNCTWRVNNVSLRQESLADVLEVGPNHMMELDTVRFYSQKTRGITCEQEANLLLRNVSATCSREALLAGKVVIILNCLFNGCGSSKDEIEEEDPYADFPTVNLQHFTHMLFWNSEINSSVGHPIGKEYKIEFDETKEQQMIKMISALSMMDGIFPQGTDPEALFQLVKSKEESAMSLPAGHRTLRGRVAFRNNKACTPLCAIQLQDPNFCYCPSMEEEEGLVIRQSWMKLMEWAKTFQKKGVEGLEGLHHEAAKKWNLVGLVDPLFVAEEFWKRYMNHREASFKSSLEEGEDKYEITPKKLRKASDYYVTEMLKKIPVSGWERETFQKLFLDSLTFSDIAVDFEFDSRKKIESLNCVCRIYSLNATGVYVDFSYNTHFRARWHYCENYDTLSVTFVGQPGGANRLGQEVELLSRDEELEDESDEEGSGVKMADKEVFDCLQEILFGGKIMSLPAFVCLLVGAVGMMKFSRSDATWPLEKALKKEKARLGEEFSFSFFP